MTSEEVLMTRARPAEPCHEASERWTLLCGGHPRVWDVLVRYHKPVDILSLKSDVVARFQSHARDIQRERSAVFGDSAALERVVACPICGMESACYQAEIRPFGACYVRCERCSHRFVENRPTPLALHAFYRDSSGYQATYADKAKAHARIEQIHAPKLEWLIGNYRRVHQRDPQTILDVGAGSGHFCACARGYGIRCDGIELSGSGRAFAREVFDVELMDGELPDHAVRLKGAYDVVTLWGLIEHVPDPVSYLRAAATAGSGPQGMVVASVPRWHSLSSTIQMRHPDRIVRHLDPLGHIHCFTDTSVCLAVSSANLSIVAAWYFGMDAYETLIQLSAETSTEALMDRELIASLQRVIDGASLSDSLVVACVPEPAAEVRGGGGLKGPALAPQGTPSKVERSAHFRASVGS